MLLIVIEYKLLSNYYYLVIIYLLKNNCYLISYFKKVCKYDLYVIIFVIILGILKCLKLMNYKGKIKSSMCEKSLVYKILVRNLDDIDL